LKRIVSWLTLAMAVAGGVSLRSASAGDDTRWAFTVLNHAAVASGRGVEKLSFPTREACEAARQGVLEMGEEQRPIPVIGRCTSEARSATRPAS